MGCMSQQGVCTDIETSLICELARGFGSGVRPLSPESRVQVRKGDCPRDFSGTNLQWRWGAGGVFLAAGLDRTTLVAPVP